MDNEIRNGENSGNENFQENNITQPSQNGLDFADEKTAEIVETQQTAEIVNDTPQIVQQNNIFSGEYHYDREQYNNQVRPSSDYGYYSQQNNRPYHQNYNYNQNNFNQNNYNPDNFNHNRNNQNPDNYNQNTDGQNNSFNNGNQPPEGFNPPPSKKNNGMKVFVALIAVIVVLSVAPIVAIFAGDGSDITPFPGIGEPSSDVVIEKPNTDNVGDIQPNAGTINAGEAVDVAKIAQQYNVGILVYQKNSLYTEGSGVVVKEDDDGKYTYIVTCAHVVNHSNVALSVLMADGTEYSADLVGMDTRTDLAVVRIEASGLTAATLASSDNLVVGQTVYAVGNPGGSEFFGSFTNGIISAIDRPVSSNTGYEMECIQHTAAINPGNSGGALENGDGQLVGINSMKIASTEYEGMGFAVPSDVVADVFNSIIANGYVAGRAKLGISYQTPSNYSQTYAMYVQMKGLPSGTIVIADISSDSDLANKDVKVGDMIVAVNGTNMTDTGMLSDMIEDMSAGDTLKLKIVRVNTDDWSQTEFEVTVTLVEDRGNATASSSSGNSSDSQDPFSNGGGADDWYEYYKDFFGY